MDVPVIIKESCPGKSDEKLIKCVVNMVGQAIHCMWHAALPLIVFLPFICGDWIKLDPRYIILSEARQTETVLYLFLKFGCF